MAVSSPHILFTGTTAYDLRRVLDYYIDPTTPTIAKVRFIDAPNSYVQFNVTTFESAYQASLDAA